MGPLNLYVNTNGNDANDGLSALTPLQHLQTAWNYITNNIDANGNSIQVNSANGAGPFTLGVFASTVPLGGSSGINFFGDPATPSNVQVNVTSGDAFVGIGGVIYQVEGFQVSASTAGGPYVGGGSGIASSGGALIYIKNVDFANCVTAQIDAEGGVITSLGRYYSISGGGSTHLFASTAGNLGTALSFVKITGTQTYTGAFAICEFNSVQSLWSQVWGNPQIVGVKVNNAGSGLTDGTRTFTAAGGFGTGSCTWTATVAGGTVTGGIVITSNGAYSVFAAVPTVTISSGNVLTFASTTGVFDGMLVGHLNIPVGTTVLSHTLTTVTMSAGVTGTISNLDDYVTFSGDPVLEANAATVDTGTTNATWDLAVALGPRFTVTYSSVINVQGASVKYLPGDVNTTPDTAHGGYYA